jgi:hypothetical protein
MIRHPRTSRTALTAVHAERPNGDFAKNQRIYGSRELLGTYREGFEVACREALRLRGFGSPELLIWPENVLRTMDAAGSCLAGALCVVGAAYES